MMGHPGLRADGGALLRQADGFPVMLHGLIAPSYLSRRLRHTFVRGHKHRIDAERCTQVLYRPGQISSRR